MHDPEFSMAAIGRLHSLCLVLIVGASATGQSDRTTPEILAGVRVDRNGDPLPQWAIARLGTLRFRQDSAIESIAFTPDGKRLLTVGGSSAVGVWEAASGRSLGEYVGEHVVKSIDVSSDGRLVVAGGGFTDSAYVWEAASRQLRRSVGNIPWRRGIRICEPATEVRSLALAPDCKILALAASIVNESRHEDGGW